VIDRQGVLSPESGGWVLDWWVRAEDRWHIASGGALVRQSLTDATPVLVSALRVPGGEIEQRAWCVVDGPSGAPLLVVEFHNATSIPVALAVGVKAAQNASTAKSSVITFNDGVVSVDGRGVARFSREPSRYGIGVDGRSAQEVTVAEDAVGEFPASGVHSNGAGAAVAFVFPLPHTATLRVAVALDGETDGKSVRCVDLSTFDFASLAPCDRVVSGWKAQLSRAPRIDVPERSIEDAVDSARAHLLVHAAYEDPLRRPGIPVSGIERAELIQALDEHGLSAEAERLLISATDLQNSDGSFDAERLDATAGWVVAAHRHCALAGNQDVANAFAERVASAAHWLAKRQRGSRLRRGSAFFGVGSGPEMLNDAERVRYDANWTMRAYGSAVSLLEAAGQTDAAVAIRRQRDDLEREMTQRGILVKGQDESGRVAAAIDRLRAELREGEPLWAWASDVDTHDPARTAGFLRGVRSLLVQDDASDVDLLPGFGEHWLGQPIAIVRLPTTAGVVSFAIRWHGARPALLWEVEGGHNIRLRCSAIDPDWSTTDLRGEVLLAAPVLDHVHTHDEDLEGISTPQPEADVPKSVAEPPQDGGGSFT